MPVPLGRPLGLGMAWAEALAVPPEALFGGTLAVAVLDIDGSRTLPVWAAVVCFCIGKATGCGMLSVSRLRAQHSTNSYVPVL